MNKSMPPTKNFLLSGGNWIACTPPPLHNAAYMNIRILSDGKQGHLNQSLGLAQALISKAGGTVETVDLQGLSLWGNPEGRHRQRHSTAGSVHFRRTCNAYPAHLRAAPFQNPGRPLHEAYASLFLFRPLPYSPP